MKEKTLIVCRPTLKLIADLIPGSVQRQCSKCKCGIWVAPATVKDMLSQKGEIVLLCTKCGILEINTASKKGHPVDYLPMSDNQKRDVINAVKGQPL